jgi:membrane protein implicated in regulation of membrane protease activity
MERWAWFILLTILMLLIFPTTVLWALLNVHAGIYQWSYLLTVLNGRLALGILDFCVMVIALLLPVKAFFSNRHASANREDGMAGGPS